jgi:hypothetical protein
MPELLRPLASSAVESGLDVTEVVVDIVHRLGAANRQKAVAKAIAARLSHLDR